MWTRRDWALMGTAAFATFGVTVALFLPRIGTAGDDKPVTEEVAVPTLRLNSVEVVAEVVKSDDIVTSKEGWVAMKPGSKPKLQLVVENKGKFTEKAEFTATLTASSARDRISRMPRINAPSWTESYSLNLNPGEKKTLDVPALLVMDVGSSARLDVFEKKVDALPVKIGEQAMSKDALKNATAAAGVTTSDSRNGNTKINGAINIGGNSLVRVASTVTLLTVSAAMPDPTKKAEKSAAAVQSANAVVATK